MIFEHSRRARARPATTRDHASHLQLHMSWAETDEEALQNAMTEWPNGGMKFPKQDIRSPMTSSRWPNWSALRTSRAGC